MWVSHNLFGDKLYRHGYCSQHLLSHNLKMGPNSKVSIGDIYYALQRFLNQEVGLVSSVKLSATSLHLDHI